MVIQLDEKAIQWKSLWQLLSGIHYATPKATVRAELASIKSELLNGIHDDPTTATTISTDQQKLTERFENLSPFLDKLAQFLDLNKAQTWRIFQAYLQHEFNGSLELLLNYLKTETNLMKMLKNVWEYQSLERMTRLKVVKMLLEFHKSAGHPFATEFKQILNDIGLDNLRKSFIEQLTQLIEVDSLFKYSHGELFNVHSTLVATAERKFREIAEILQILLLIVENDNILSGEFQTLVNLFKSHSFGRQHRHLDAVNNKMHKDLVQKITYGEVALFMKCIDANTTGRTSNPDWITDVSTALDKKIVTMHQNPEHGPLLMTWMLMKYHVIELNEENEEFRKYRQYGTKAVQLDVFGYLQTMCTHPIYRDASVAASIACRTMYNQLTFLCDIFDSGRAVSQHKNIYELLSELLKISAIAKDFCTADEGGARALLTTAIDTFPIDFIPLSMIAYSLSTTSPLANRFIRDKLEALPVYTEYYDSQRISLKPSDTVRDEFVLTNDFRPFGADIDYTISTGTVATATDKTTGTQIHFKTSLNYFVVLHHEINELLFDLIKRPEIDDQRQQRVAYGLKYLASTLRPIKSPRDIPSEMVHPTEMVFDILHKFKDVLSSPIELLAECVQVCVALVPMLQGDIWKRVVNLDLLPVCTNPKLECREYAHGISLDTARVGHYLVSFEKTLGRFEFLSAYLTFLRTFVEFELNETVQMELAGLVFLLREVFPFIHTWRFEREVDRQRLTTQVLQYFCDILQIRDENVNRSILRNTCVYSLLHLDGAITLLRIVALGNGYIEEIMQNESNWMSAENTSFNLLVRLSMTIFMHILRLRNTIAIKSDGGLSPLENAIYSQPKHVIPVVTGYMRNIFNRRLPILACSLLRRFATEFKMSLLACLDMEPSQIRTTFLAPLENELESDQLKIAVLEFIEACIEKQPGLTEAFFKLNHDDVSTSDPKKQTDAKQKDFGNSVLSFMTLYLDEVAKNPNAVSDTTNDEGKLLSQIMSLFHSIWKNNMQTLVDKLINGKDFWSSIMNPLFGHIQPNVRVYSQLFNMIGLELYRLTDAKNINVNFAQTLDRFLTKDVFFDWVDNILDIPESMDTVTDETPGWLSRLQSFKDLFVIILRRESRHGVKVPADSLEYFTDQCLMRLTERVHRTDDLRPFIVLSELYLFLLLSHKHKYKDSPADDTVILRKIAELAHELSVSYDEMHARAKESILAITFYAMHLFGDELNANADTTINFIDSIVLILCHESYNTEVAYKSKTKPVNGERKNLSFVLTVNTLKSLLNHFDGQQSNILDRLQSTQIFSRILSCLNVTLPLHAARKLSTEMLDLLNVFAASPVYSQLMLHCDVGDYLWLKLLPPKELANTDASSTSWQSNEFWPIYARGIRLVSHMLRQHGLLYAKEAISFVGVHEIFLMDSVLLAKSTLDRSPLELTESALELIDELIKYEKQWRLEHQQSMINLMRCVQVILDHAVSLLYRPKILKLLLKETITGQTGQAAKDVSPTKPYNAVESDSFKDEINAMNTLIKIVVICAKSLLVFSPTVLDLLTSCDFTPAKWQPLIEIQFNAPKLNVGASYPQLTFGTVLNAAAIFTKALLLQQYAFDGVALNEIHDSIADVNDGDRSSLNYSRGERRRNCTTTMSLLSTSASTVPNEYLANLDVDLCFSALEYILTLLASQSLLAIKLVNLSQREKQLIKRELCTELSVFHEFVKKRILADESRDDPLRRRKHGLVQMESCNLHSQSSADNHLSIGGRQIGGDSLRVRVTRKLHLEMQHTPKQAPRKSSQVFDMTQQLSPISDATQQSAAGPSTSTGITGRLPLLPSSTPSVATQPSTKRNIDPLSGIDVDDDYSSGGKYFVEVDVDETELFFEPEDPTFCELSFVRLVEEDYFHFLSNLFTYICQSETIN